MLIVTCISVSSSLSNIRQQTRGTSDIMWLVVNKICTSIRNIIPEHFCKYNERYSTLISAFLDKVSSDEEIIVIDK